MPQTFVKLPGNRNALSLLRNVHRALPKYSAALHVHSRSVLSPIDIYRYIPVPTERILAARRRIRPSKRVSFREKKERREGTGGRSRESNPLSGFAPLSSRSSRPRPGSSVSDRAVRSGDAIPDTFRADDERPVKVGSVNFAI